MQIKGFCVFVLLIGFTETCQKFSNLSVLCGKLCFLTFKFGIFVSQFGVFVSQFGVFVSQFGPLTIKLRICCSKLFFRPFVPVLLDSFPVKEIFSRLTLLTDQTVLV